MPPPLTFPLWFCIISSPFLIIIEMVEFMMMWRSIAAWFTPTVLFCLTNFIIATIFIASNKHHHHDVNAHNINNGDSNSLTPIARVSSFLDRARSIKLSSYTTTTESVHQYPPQSKTADYSSTSRLAQSIYLSDSEGNSVSQLAPSLFERVRSIKFSSDQSDQISNEPGKLARVPSFFDRVKSFKISTVFNADPDPDPSHHVTRSKSDKAPAKKSLTEMKKSRSEVRIASDDDSDGDDELRRPATARERRNDVDEEVDAKADDFISRFKQQLKLQRLESLVRYNDLVNRRR